MPRRRNAESARAVARDARLITDVGSTKARIVAAASEVGLGDRFVGSHPMAGGHQSGWGASRAGLFEARASFSVRRPARMKRHARWPANSGATSVGVRSAWTRTATTGKWRGRSHLPHIVSTALALTLADANICRADLGPGGRDVTRLAGSSADVWTAIAHDNSAAIDGALAAAEVGIAAFRRALARNDAAALHERFSAARIWFDDSSRAS